MKKLKKIRIARESFGVGYFLLFAVCILILPEVICAFKMIGTQSGLQQETVLAVRGVSYIVSLPFLYLAFSSVLNKRGERQFCNIIVFLRAFLWAAAWLTSFIAMTDLMFEKGSLFKNMIQNNTNLYLGVVIAICVAEVLVGIYLLFYMGFILSPVNQGKGGLSAFKYFVTHPLCILESVGFGVLFVAAGEGIPYLFEKLSMKLSFVSRLVPFIILSVVEAAILYCFYLREESRMYKYAAGQTDGNENVERQKKKLIFNSVSFVLSIAVIAGFLAVDGAEYRKRTVNEEIIADIELQVINGKRSLLEGDLDQALVYYRSASARAKAWTAVLEEDEETLIQLAEEYSSDIQVTYLYLMTREDTAELENFLRSDAMGYVWCHNLLTRYSQLGERNLTDIQEALKKEALYICIANGSYIDESINPEMIEKKKNLISQLQTYDEVDLYADMLEQVAEVGREGTLNQNMVNSFLDIAEENPDIFICQYLAYVMGTSYLDDDASHYGRTVEVIKAYDRLFEKEDVTADQIKAEKLEAASGCIKCQDYETAVEFLEEAADLGAGEAADMLIMQCYAKLDETEECYQYAKDILEENPDNLTALYYASTESLKQEKLDESIEYAVMLAEQAAEAEDDYEAEILLYQYAQFMVIDDSSTWTDYVYSQYENLTEEQWNTINESHLLADYLNALYYTFEDRDYEKAAASADSILEINANYPQANYLKAVILYQNKEFEESVTYYKRSLSVIGDSANVWFGLANAYDAMEEYELAYQCCEKVASLKPYMNHDSSWYGVSVHNNNLMKSLKKYVEEER